MQPFTLSYSNRFIKSYAPSGLALSSEIPEHPRTQLTPEKSREQETGDSVGLGSGNQENRHGNYEVIFLLVLVCVFILGSSRVIITPFSSPVLLKSTHYASLSFLLIFFAGFCLSTTMSSNIRLWGRRNARGPLPRVLGARHLQNDVLYAMSCGDGPPIIKVGTYHMLSLINARHKRARNIHTAHPDANKLELDQTALLRGGRISRGGFKIMCL
ncbi:hypothetical protein DFH94DRAFT_407069 [Russula ochroleuca]|jgi:hypothetical protein|uniref:Uncharacterized protein n=1 Tax=Russula ochroleuca TaxID=152965 RepID=A0A9P5TAD3_9AGAM|nr:hypothetical protein DFH94DRAFT_407069 [Russula ochroleuca]